MLCAVAWRRSGLSLKPSRHVRREFLGANTDVFSGNLYVDPNEVRLDGSRNPYFGQTYLGVRFPTFGYAPLDRETYRAQLAYRLDLAKEKNFLRWLGRTSSSAMVNTRTACSVA